MLFVSNYSYGQENIGLKFGLNVSNINNSKENNTPDLLDFNTGIVLRFKLRKKLLLTTEALVSNEGFNSLLIPSGTIANHLTYLSFPALLTYFSTDKIYFQIGPEFNFLIHAKMKSSTLDANVTDDYNMFDFSLAAGLGFKVLKKFNLETRYSFGLSQIRKDEKYFGSFKNRNLQLNLIYFLKSKH